MKFDVISFGSATLDVFLKSPDFQIVKAAKNAFIQNSLVIPYGVKAEVTDLVMNSGGGGTNTAVGFARLGLKSAVVARCGWDFAGKMVRSEIKKEKVADEFLVQLEGEKTDYSTILIGPDGNRTILVYRGGTRLESTFLDFKKLNSLWFYVASLEGNLDLLADLIDFSQKNHVKVALNPGKKEIEQKERLLNLAKKAEVFNVNQEEASLLTGEEKAFEKLVELLPQTTVVVTKGAEGVVVNFPYQGILMMEGFNVKMADQTGAGDGFGAGFVGGLAKGLELEKALKLGVANGASVVTKIGAKEGLIKEQEIDYWLEKPLKFVWHKS